MSTAIQRAEPSFGGNFPVLISKDGLDFRQIVLRTSLPTGREILETSGFAPDASVALFAILASGDFEDVRLDETFDVSGAGAEKFVAFATDRTFRFTLSGDQIEWGKPAISGAVIANLALAGPGTAVFRHVDDGPDHQVAPTDIVDLGQPGIERFYLAQAAMETSIIVNGRARTVPGDEVTFEDIIQIAFPNDATPNVVFSMTYRHAASQPHNGNLAVGGTVRVKKGTVFNVTRTVQS